MQTHSYGGYLMLYVRTRWLLRVWLVCLLIAVLAVYLPGCASNAVDHKIVQTVHHSNIGDTVVVAAEAPADDLDPRAFRYYVNAIILEQAGEITHASENYKRALQYHPNSHEIRLSFARTLLRLQKFQDVIAALEVIKPKDADVYRLRAAAHRAMGQADSTRASYLRLVELDPRSRGAYAFLAASYRKSNDLDSAIWACRNLARLMPNDHEIWYELGKMQASRQKYAAAKESFRRSIEVRADETNVLAFAQLGDLYQAEGFADSALAVYETALEIDPENLVLNRYMAAFYVEADSLDRALPYARKVVEISPQDRSAARRVGILYFALDSMGLADSVFSNLVRSGDLNVSNHYYIGRIAVLNDDLESARDQFALVTQMADSVCQGWLDLGYVYRRLKEPEKELETYRVGLTHARDDESRDKLLFALGSACEQYGFIRESIDTFEELLSLSPDHAGALNYLGYMLVDRGDSLLYAKGLIERALSIQPESPAFLDSYGWAFYRLGNYKEAMIHLKKAAELDNDPVILDHLGDNCKAAGNMEQARLWWQKALEQDPDNEQIKKKLSR